MAFMSIILFRHFDKFSWAYLILLDFKAKINFHEYLMNSEEVKNQSKTPLMLTWQDIDQLKRFVTETGKILPRRITGLSAQAQRHITKMIKQGRNMLTMK